MTEGKPPDWERIQNSAVWEEEILPWLTEERLATLEALAVTPAEHVRAVQSRAATLKYIAEYPAAQIALNRKKREEAAKHEESNGRRDTGDGTTGNRLSRKFAARQAAKL